jgi:hypothetical protein
LFCPADAASSLGLGGPQQAMGCIAAGYPAAESPPRTPPGRKSLDTR